MATKAIELLKDILKSACRVDSLHAEEDKAKGSISAGLLKVAHECQTLAQFDGTIETFKIHLRTDEGQKWLKASGVKLEEKTKTEGEKTVAVYLLPRSFIQPASNIRRSFRLADAGKLYAEADVSKLAKGEKAVPVKVADFKTEAELRAATQESKKHFDAIELRDAASQGRQVRRNGVLVDAKEEAMRGECLDFVVTVDRGIRLLRGDRLAELRTALMELAQQAQGELVAQKAADDEATKQQAEAKAQAETDANANKGQMPAPATPAPEAAPGMEANG